MGKNLWPDDLTTSHKENENAGDMSQKGEGTWAKKSFQINSYCSRNDVGKIISTVGKPKTEGQIVLRPSSSRETGLSVGQALKGAVRKKKSAAKTRGFW